MNINQSNAARWDVTKQLAVAATSSDNITLSPEPYEQGDRILELVPEIAVHANGSRLNFNMEYQLQGVFFDNNNESNDIYHDLDARGNSQLIDEYLYLDFSALYTQRIIDPTVSLPTNNLSITNNTADVGSYSISPYLRNRFGQSIEGELRYRYDKIDNRDESLFDSTSRNIYADLFSLEGQQRLGWHLSYRNTETESDDGSIWKYERSGLDLNYLITRRFSLLAEGGYEKNEYEDVALLDEGSFWNAGFLWKPSRRTSLEVRAGHRFFGNTGSIAFNQTGRHWVWHLSYHEDFETSNTAQLSRQAEVDVGEQVTSTIDPAISSGAYLSKNLMLAVTRNSSKTELSVGFDKIDRNYQVLELDEEVYGLNVNWTWKLARRTEVSIGGMWQQQDRQATNNEIKDSVSDFSVMRKVSRDSDLTFAYRNQKRKSDILNGNYEQNSYTISMNVTF